MGSHWLEFFCPTEQSRHRVTIISLVDATLWSTPGQGRHIPGTRRMPHRDQPNAPFPSLNRNSSVVDLLPIPFGLCFIVFSNQYHRLPNNKA